MIVGDFIGVDNEIHGFVDNGGVFTTIDVPEAISTIVNGINDAGQIVGDFTDSGSSTNHGFLATPLAVPEPSSLALMLAAGATGLLYRVRPRQGKKVSGLPLRL